MYHYIYKITLLLGELAGKYYYGKRSTSKLPENDIKYTGSGKIVSNYFNKYGKIPGITHIKEIIELNPDKYTNAEREKEYVNPNLKDKMCVNLTCGGFGGGVPGHIGAWRGKHHSKETKEKMSKAQKGKKISEEQRIFLSVINTGKHHSEESKQKMSKAKMGHTPWNKGKTYHSEKMSAIMKERWADEEYRKLACERYKQSHKLKPPYNKGLKMSEEQKKKCSEHARLKTPVTTIRLEDGFTKDYDTMKAAAAVIKTTSSNIRQRLKRNPSGIVVNGYFVKHKETA